MNKFFKCIAVAGISTLFLSGLSQEAFSAPKKPLEIRVSYVFKTNEPTHIAMEEAAKNINEKLDGEVKFLLFPNGELPIYKDGMEQVVRGANYISVEDPTYVGDYVPDFTALVGPMLYQNYDEYLAMLETPLVKDLVKKAENKGIKILSLGYIFGFRSVITNKEIVEPADLKGLKIRVPASKLFVDSLNAMGANAVSMPFGETIPALQQGVIDGLEGSLATNYLTKTYELRKNMSLTNHFIGTAGVYISTRVWDKMTDKQRDIIQEEITKAAINNNKRMVELDKELVTKLQSEGVKINEVNQPAFAELTKKVYDTFPGFTPGIYDKLNAELKVIRENLKNKN